MPVCETVQKRGRWWGQKEEKKKDGEDQRVVWKEGVWGKHSVEVNQVFQSKYHRPQVHAIKLLQPNRRSHALHFQNWFQQVAFPWQVLTNIHNQ